MSVYDIIEDSSSPDTSLGEFSMWSGLNPVAAGNYVGDVLGLGNGQQIKAALAELSGLSDQAEATSEANKSLYGDWYSQMRDLYAANADKYSEAFDNYVNAVNGAAGKSYEYSGDISDFYSPFAAQRKQAAMDAITNSSANAGNMFSSDYLNSLAAKQQALASEEWDKAFTRMQSDRQNDINEWSVNRNQEQQDLTNANNVLNLYGNDRNMLASAYGDYVSNLASQNNADLSAASDLALKKAELQAGRTSGNAGVLNLAGNVLGAIFGA